MYVDCSGCPYAVICVRCSRWRRYRNEARCLLIARLEYGADVQLLNFLAECCLTEEEIHAFEKEEES